MAIESEPDPHGPNGSVPPVTWPSSPLLMLVSDRKRYADRRMEDIFMAAIDGGVNLVHLWEADLSARDLLGEAERLRHLALGGVLLFVHDRADIALAAQADGVHLSHESLPVEAVRSIAPLTVGKSVASVADAVAAVQSGASFLLVGPVFFSTHAPDRSPLGPTLVRRIKARVAVPLLAAGGITAGNAHQVIGAGADGIAVTSEILDAEDPRAAARTLMEAMREAWQTRPLHRS